MQSSIAPLPTHINMSWGVLLGFSSWIGSNLVACRAKLFLQRVLEVYSTKYMKASRMLGDQLALAWVVKSNPSFDAKKFTRRQSFLDKIDGASILFLPCALYNWTPPEGAGQFHGMPLDVKVHIPIILFLKLVHDLVFLRNYICLFTLYSFESLFADSRSNLDFEQLILRNKPYVFRLELCLYFSYR